MSFWFDDVVIGDVMPMGEWTFTAEDIIAFGRKYDPQYFHVDAKAAKRSQFGGLIASGWHTASISMKMIVQSLRRADDAMRVSGGTPAESGGSPGFKNLRWPRPVRAGDTLVYTRTVTGKRESGSRKGWGLVFARIEATNQRGEVAFSFDSTVFAPLRREEPA